MDRRKFLLSMPAAGLAVAAPVALPAISAPAEPVVPITDEALRAIAGWRATQRASKEGWGRYCSLPRGPEQEEVYAEWRVLSERNQDALTDMISALYQDGI